MGDRYIFVLIDGSASMWGEEQDIASHLNSTLEVIAKKQKEGDNRPIQVSVLSFSEGFTEIIPNTRLTKEGPRLDPCLLESQGETALYDAVGRTVDDLHVLSDTSLKDIIIIVATDGRDNASKLYDATRVRKTVANHRDQGVTFIYIAAGEDALVAGVEMGLCEKECLKVRNDESIGSCFTSQMVRGAMSQALGIDLKEEDYPPEFDQEEGESSKKKNKVDDCEIYSQYY